MEEYIKIVQKKENELTENDKRILKAITDEAIIEYFVRMDLYFIKYLNIKDNIDLGDAITSYLLDFKSIIKRMYNETRTFLNSININSEYELAYQISTTNKRTNQTLWEGIEKVKNNIEKEIEKNYKITPEQKTEIENVAKYLNDDTLIELIKLDIISSLSIGKEKVIQLLEIDKKLIEHINEKILTEEMLISVIERGYVPRQEPEYIVNKIYDSYKCCELLIEKGRINLSKIKKEIIDYRLIILAIQNQKPEIIDYINNLDEYIKEVDDKKNIIYQAINNGYNINEKSSPIILSNPKYIKHAVEKGQNDALNYVYSQGINEEILTLALQNGYEINSSTSLAILNNPIYVKIIIDKGQYNVVNYVTEKVLNEEILTLAINKGYKVDYNTSKIITNNPNCIRYAIKNGLPNSINYAEGQGFTDENFYLAIQEGYAKLSNCIALMSNRIKEPKYIRVVLENGYADTIDLIEQSLITRELVKIALSKGYKNISNLKVKKIILEDIELLKQIIENGRKKIIDELEDKEIIEKLFYFSLNEGYMISDSSSHIIRSNPDYIKAAIEKGQKKAILYAHGEANNIELLKLCLQEINGYEQSSEEFLKYINQITKKNFQNYQQFLHINKLLYDLLFELGKYKLISTDLKFEEALFKIKELLKVTRISGMNIDFNSIIEMDIEQIQKFKTKVWKEFSSHRVFTQDANTKRALVEVIAIYGLFYDDKDVNKRCELLRKLINKVPNRFNYIDYEKIIEKKPALKELMTKVSGIKYKLKQNVEIPTILLEYSKYLKSELDEKDYHFLKKLVPNGRTGSEMNKFLKNNYEEFEDIYYIIDNSKINKDNIRDINDTIFSVDIKGELTYDSLHRLFSGCRQEYNSEFFEFLINNISFILYDSLNQKDLKEIQTNFEKIKANNNNSESVPYGLALNYLTNICFENIKFGYESFAEEAKAAGITSQRRYDYYQKLYEEMKTIKFTSLPNYKKEFEFENNGKITKFRARRLRKDEALGLFVGEKNYTNCCQVFDDAGEECNRHSALSPDGGVFITEIYINGTWKLLTQSWDWTNEGVYCHDNIEATNLFKEAPEALRKIVSQMYSDHANSIISISENTVKEYIMKLEKQKNISLETKNEIKQRVLRQAIKLVTVGVGCDDLQVGKYFKEQCPKPRGPKNYDGYRDSRYQLIISGKEKELIPESTEYQSIPLYREEARRIQKIEKGGNITSHTLRKIYDIKTKNGENNYIDETKSFGENIKIIENKYGIEIDKLSIIIGDDWYIIYNLDNETLSILDLGTETPIVAEDKYQQECEIKKALYKIINENPNRIISIPLNNSTKDIYIEMLKTGIIEEHEISNNFIKIKAKSDMGIKLKL